MKEANLKKILNQKENTKKQQIYTRKILNNKNFIREGNILRILSQKRNMKKRNNQRNPEPKREYEKTNLSQVLNQKENMKKSKYEENPKPKKENCKKMHKKSKKCLNKVTKNKIKIQ